MIEFIKGNLFNCNCEALVNTCNCVGVMGRGIALEFKNRYPEMFEDYKNFCNLNKLRPGKLHVFEQKTTPRLIINFPTKVDWRNESKYPWIESGLLALREVIIDKNIKSIAIPALGCGLGGLQWSIVKPLIQSFHDSLSCINIIVLVYEPQ